MARTGAKNGQHQQQLITVRKRYYMRCECVGVLKNNFRVANFECALRSRMGLNDGVHWAERRWESLLACSLFDCIGFCVVQWAFFWRYSRPRPALSNSFSVRLEEALKNEDYINCCARYNLFRIFIFISSTFLMCSETETSKRAKKQRLNSEPRIFHCDP